MLIILLYSIQWNISIGRKHNDIIKLRYRYLNGISHSDQTILINIMIALF